MNQVAEVQPTPTEIIGGMEEKFRQVNTFQMDFKREALFACHAMESNEYLEKAARGNPRSLKHALLNVAATGLSLNPATHDAYLVPRGGAICLDISYKGLLKVATESGAIKWAKADLVYSSDQFVYKGPSVMPEHYADPFVSDRGEIRGVYCIAKTKDDDILVEIMRSEDIEAIKAASPSAKGNSSPWKKFEGEMWKKACIKRAAKTWPRVESSERFSEAVSMLNEYEGYEFGQAKEVSYEVNQRALALFAPKAQKILDLTEAGEYWELGTIMENLTEEDQQAINTAKSKGGYFNAQDKQARSDLMRQFYVDKNAILDGLADSLTAVSDALNDGDDLALGEALAELDEKEFYVLCHSESYDEETVERFNKILEE